MEKLYEIVKILNDLFIEIKQNELVKGISKYKEEQIEVYFENIEKSLANGYALLIGVIGCIASGAICAKLFRPKRTVEEKFEFENIENILESAGITLEEEREALSKLDSETIKELEDLELYALLALIPEDSKNYKKEYKEKAKGGV